jgi:hypothetical protein
MPLAASGGPNRATPLPQGGNEDDDDEEDDDDDEDDNGRPQLGSRGGHAIRRDPRYCR